MNNLISIGITAIEFIVMLGILVFVHELGHFAVAKRLGIPVFEFGFGFPPRLKRFWRDNGYLEVQGRRIFVPRDFKWERTVNIGTLVRYKTEMQNGRETLVALRVAEPDSADEEFASPVQAVDMGTEYTLNWIPLGGFVKLVGEEDPNVQGGFATAKPSVRAPILLAGVTMNLILAFVVFALLAFITPPYAAVQTTRIYGVVANSPAAEAGLRTNDQIVAINGQALNDNFTLLSQLLKQNAGRAVTLTVTRNGQTLEPVQATPRINPPRGEGPLGISLAGYRGIRVSAVAPGSVAEQAGIRAGDVMVFIVDPAKSRTLTDQNELAQFTQTHQGWKIEWRVVRDGKLSAPITVQIPQQVDASNATLGLDLTTSIIAAPLRAVEQMGLVLSTIPTMFSQLFAGNAPANAFVGPLGIAQLTNEVSQAAGLIGLLELLALLSLNLAFVNILPLPALDGGRLLFVALEWLRGGKRIDPEKEGLVHLVGIVVLLGLMVLISVFDVQRLATGQPILTP